MFTKILVAIDDSPPALGALKVAVELAEQLGAQLKVLHVLDVALAFVPEVAVCDDSAIAELRRAGEQLLDDACARVPATVPFARTLVDGDPGDTIVATARQWAADLVVIGTESRGRLAHFLLGRTADSVIRKAPCPVLSVRAGLPAEATTANDVAVP